MKSGDAGDIRIETEYDRIEAPVRKGDKLGSYYVYVDNELIAKKSLIATESIVTGWFPSYIYISNHASAIIAGVLASLILIIILIVIILRLRTPRYQSRH